MYGIEVSPEFISAVTDEVMAEIDRLAEPAARADVPGGVLRRAAGEDPRRRVVRNKAVYLALGVLPDGTQATCWGSGSSRPRAPSSGCKVFNELKTRGVDDILIAVVDGLKGFPRRSRRCSPRPRCRPASCT
jgi:putative transposase